jgi:uncharacterized membrane protein YfcA
MSGELILILVVMFFSFWVKAIAGFGGPLLSVPLLTPFIGIEAAVVVMSLANAVANIMLLWSNRRAAHGIWPLFARVAVTAAVGVVAGTVLLTRLDDAILSLFLAATVLLYIVVSLTRPEFHLSEEQGRKAAWFMGTVGGLVHGSTGNSGTIFGSFYHSLRMPRDQYVFIITLTFLALGSLQIGTLLNLGSFTDERTQQAVLSIVPVVIATPLGERVSRRLDPKVFGRVVLALLAVAAVSLVVAAVS